ncbi:MAG: hypothetical protein E3J86_13975 [Candidatus Thorarchaeota archaeon]|nr:MAG: hypothetical protein E3J86_13975 [Candidatus Thorarchaeota archaeon]
MNERNNASLLNNLWKLTSVGFTVSVIGMIMSAFNLAYEIATIFNISMWFFLIVTGILYYALRSDGQS